MTALELTHELWDQHEHACPYLRHDERGCFCTSPALSDGSDRYSPCCTASLQIWCLTDDHYTRCHFYPAGDAP